ncbi:hypothetical protein E4U09_002454 [Claviceps aff. purpurea]|uniref:Homeobox domain-containing protein n=1 Tax=Claviceps aff. purpurea TaxID=1967640 RepID=A0A9P7QIJ0_9HYPO|nr:hypothetical protein E4U09_002454 [Claviceps aff. purpurea]
MSKCHPRSPHTNAGSQTLSGYTISALPPPMVMASRSEIRSSYSHPPPSLKFEGGISVSRPRETMVHELIKTPMVASESKHEPSGIANMPSPPRNRSQDYGYPYHYSSNFHASPPSASRPPESAPSSTDAVSVLQYQDARQSSETCTSADLNKRKRRGNLPKETTEKLRAWFLTHLEHPYPTEDEKQDLMQQTGLQMNQISNWFINARRRQLPTMINNARVEADAATSRSLTSHHMHLPMLASAEYVSEYGGRREDRFPFSDSEAYGYEDGMYTSLT